MAYKRTSPMPIVEGGTNAASMANTDGVVYFDGSALATTAVGTSGDVLTSNGAGVAPTFQPAGGGGGVTIDGDSGSATGATITFNGASNAGPTIKFVASASTVNFDVTGTDQSTIMGQSSHFNSGSQANLTGFGYGNFKSTGSISSSVAFGDNVLTLAASGGNTVAIGSSAMNRATAPNNCVGIGSNALNNVTGGNNNIGIGTGSGATMGTASDNVLISQDSGGSITTGSQNIGIGFAAFLNEGMLNGMTTGSGNTAIGYQVGSNYSAGESFNILLGQQYGVNGESHVTRIGNSDSGTSQSSCFIEGIRGKTTGVADAIAVLIDSAGQLGTVSSSLRYKDNVKDMGSDSSAILSLRPVTFTYKSDAKQRVNPGLIAEEVHEVMPALVVYDKEGDAETVRYHELVPLLLNELQKQNKRIEALEALLVTRS